MKFRSKYYIFLLTALLSCKKDFLNVQDNKNINRQDYVKDLGTLNEFLNGIYLKYAEVMEDFAPAAYPEVISDNLKPTDANGGRLAIHYSWSQVPDRTDIGEIGGRNVGSMTMNGLWMSGYRIIRAASFVIEDADKYRKENTEMASDMKGQAYAIRALVHFKIVNAFAQTYAFTSDGGHPGVPYIKTSDISKPYNRQSVAEVYNSMIEDLKAAIQLLKENENDPRFMNRLAARALLARIYLFKGEYENARQLALEVTAKIPLMTTAQGYPDAVFKFVKLPNTETLFQITPANPFFLGRVLTSPKFFLTTSDLAMLLKEDAGDIRSKWATQSGSDWNATKFPSDAAPEVIPAISPGSGAYYSSVIRSSEMFLTVAEAAAMLGDENMAREYLNKICKRANSAAETVTAVGAELLELIYKERRKELCFEGLRMGDLQRWKLGVHRIDAPVASAKNLPFGSNRAIAPIPPQDVELMGIPQNKGY